MILVVSINIDIIVVALLPGNSFLLSNVIDFHSHRALIAAPSLGVVDTAQEKITEHSPVDSRNLSFRATHLMFSK